MGYYLAILLTVGVRNSGKYLITPNEI